MRRASIALSLVGMCLIAPRPAGADAPETRRGSAGHLLRDRGTMELIVAEGGWKTAFGVTRQAPGFDILGAAFDLTLGMDVAMGLGVVANGRFYFNGADASAYLEGTGGLGLQIRLNDYAQLRLGADAGQVRHGALDAPYVGGHIVTSLGLFSLGPGRIMVVFHARLDAGGLIDAPADLPEAQTGLSIGLGLRY